jgi:hypothetical protein
MLQASPDPRLRVPGQRVPRPKAIDVADDPDFAEAVHPRGGMSSAPRMYLKRVIGSIPVIPTIQSSETWT